LPLKVISSPKILKKLPSLNPKTGILLKAKKVVNEDYRQSKILAMD
jgi:hypothetical protein